ncbi:similar to KIAA0377-like protein (predicted), isoform CRA_a [Rattus norvegicus]|uniref:Inositol hexakisphosphate and diphosphoinositol-pentakisphosphate kinase n=1 Tax=Rattus norvegicus TaxID=10116 RepID=A6HPN5_RAT|nr:similar to KIAA0377-like protein (predicted), isoform CRA_a [Rattus norvegicus]
MPTDGTDVKVYTVGPDYAHAEARKSPALDGKVERDSEGKEVRYPVMLTAMEKLVARKVCVAFKQTVCGFDLLRANGHSFVCDVNGFSFVKNSMKYYDDCAKILGNTIMRELAPQFQIPWSIPTEAEDIPIVPTTSGTMFFALFEKHGGYKTGKLKLKRPEQLQEVLDITRLLLAELEKEPGAEIEEKTGKLEQLKSVLEMYGHFSGINRKVQLTYYPHGVKASSEGQDLQREPPAPSLLLVLKWGGELTPDGRVQAEELGRAFRCMYPGGQGDYAGFPGCGLLRLHSTFRHDLKIYASDEGRVQMTAAAFAKGLLALEGELTPILVQMVKSANMNGLLDSDSDSLSSCQHRVKARLHHILQQDAPFGPEDYDQLAPTGSTSLLNSMSVIQNPVKVCDQVFALIENLTHQIRERMQDPSSVDLQLYHSETLELMLQRWSKLERDFRQKSGRYDISKIPDIYDCVKYDVQHNGSLGLQGTAELLRLSKALADVVIPQETKDAQWQRALAYLSAISELNYMTQIVIMLYEDNTRDPLSEERFHVELHFSPGVKGVEEGSAPAGCGFRPASSENEEMKTDPGSIENLCPAKPSDEPDRALQTSPQPVEGTGLPRRSPLIRNRKAGSMEVLSETSSSRPGGYRLFSSSRPPTEMKQSGLGSQCTGLFSTTVLGGSSSAPNLQDYARTHGKKLPPAGLKHRDELLDDQHPVVRLLRTLSSDCPRGWPVSLDATLAHHLHQCSYHLRLFRNWLRSGQDDPECLYGFEGCSMVPTIYPLETLHNALSLRQVSEFLTKVCQRHTDAHAQASADSSGPSSTVSSAGPSSPTTVDGNSHFGFSDQSSVNTQMIEEKQGLGLLQETPGDGTPEFHIELAESTQSPQEPPVEISPPGSQDDTEVNQTCQEVPDTIQPCHDILEEIGQPNQEVPDISQLLLKNHDTATNTCQPCQASQLSKKVYEEICQLCQDNPEESNQLCQEVSVELGRMVHRFPVSIGSTTQETLMEIGRPTQEIPEEPCQEFSEKVGMLTQKASAISELSQDILETDNPSQELSEETDLQAQEVSEEIDQEPEVVPEVVDELSNEDIS